MAGSTRISKSGAKHFYYHCKSCGKERYPVAKLHDEFDYLLSLFKFKKNPTELFDTVVKKYLEKDTKSNKIENVKSSNELHLLDTSLQNLQILYIDGKIETSEYPKLRAKFTIEIDNIKHIKAGNKSVKKETLDNLLDSINLFKTPPKALISMNIADKHEILCSIFPEKLKFDGENCRTPFSSKVLDLILTVDKGLEGNKKRDKTKKLVCPFRWTRRD